MLGEMGADPMPDFARAFQTYRRGAEVAPDYSLVYQNEAWAHYFAAKYRIRRGESPEPHIEEAFAKARRASDLDETVGVKLCVASLYRLRAEYLWSSKRDPQADLKAARRAFNALIKENPTYLEAWRSSGRLATLDARWRIATGRDATDALALAQEHIDRAHELRPGLLPILTARARLGLVNTRMDEPSPSNETAAAAIQVVEQRNDWLEALAIYASVRGRQISGTLTRKLAKRTSVTKPKAEGSRQAQ